MEPHSLIIGRIYVRSTAMRPNETGNGRFPDNHFPRTDVSRTICITNFEYFELFM